MSADKGKLVISVGDRTNDGKIDITIEVHGRFPWETESRKIIAIGPYNAPYEHVLKVVDGIAATAPFPVVKSVVPLITGIMRAFFAT